MIITGLQIRVEAPIDDDITKFTCIGKNYSIKGISSRRHLVPQKLGTATIINGFQRQYIATEQGTEETCEVFVYYYTAMENKRWAVIDAIDLKD